VIPCCPFLSAIWTGLFVVRGASGQSVIKIPEIHVAHCLKVDEKLMGMMFGIKHHGHLFPLLDPPLLTLILPFSALFSHQPVSLPPPLSLSLS